MEAVTNDRVYQVSAKMTGSFQWIRSACHCGMTFELHRGSRVVQSAARARESRELLRGKKRPGLRFANGERGPSVHSYTVTIHYTTALLLYRPHPPLCLSLSFSLSILGDLPLSISATAEWRHHELRWARRSGHEGQPHIACVANPTYTETERARANDTHGERLSQRERSRETAPFSPWPFHRSPR